jgi:hypothetical protein
MLVPAALAVAAMSPAAPRVSAPVATAAMTARLRRTDVAAFAPGVELEVEDMRR